MKGQQKVVSVGEGPEGTAVGKVKYRSGDVYCGHLVKGKRNGFGKYLWTNGNSFEGDWLQGTMHGKGTFKWASGDVYHGEFSQNKACGNGTKVFANGDRFEGVWEKNEPHGYGIKYFACGDQFEGLFHANKRNGYGIYRWAGEKDYCEGMWKNDKLNGVAITCFDGKIFRGEFRDGTPCGRGMEKDIKESQIVQGEWVDGNKSGVMYSFSETHCTCEIWEGGVKLKEVERIRSSTSSDMLDGV